MTNEQLERANTVFKKLCELLDGNKWSYTKDEENLKIDLTTRGEDLPIDIRIKVDQERQLVLLLSPMPFIIPEDRRLDIAIATNAVNSIMVDGSFDFNVKNGSMFFRITNSFIESEIGNEVLNYLLMVSCYSIDEYNDKFLMLSKGMMSVEDFISKMQ